MKVRNVRILEDEGTRVLLGGERVDTGELVSFHVVLTNDHGLKLVNMVKGAGKNIEVDLGELGRASPVERAPEHQWLDKIAEGNLPTNEQCEQCGVALFTDEMDDKRCRVHRDG